MRREQEKVRLPESIKATYGFTYNLKYNEAYKTFLVLAKKWSDKFRIIVGIFLTVVASGMLILYFLDSRKIHYFFIAIIAILLLFYLIYAPVLKAKRGAKKVQKQHGTYKIQITARGKIMLPRTEPIELAGDKDARVIETDEIFAIRTDSTNTFCLPKRIMTEDEIKEIRELFKAYIKYQTR